MVRFYPALDSLMGGLGNAASIDLPKQLTATADGEPNPEIEAEVMAEIGDAEAAC